MNVHDLADGFCEWVKLDESRDIDSPEFRAELARLFECVAAETRAAEVADEDRRVWCDGFVRQRMMSWRPVSRFPEAQAKEFADAVLAAWREARAAWGGRS